MSKYWQVDNAGISSERIDWAWRTKRGHAGWLVGRRETQKKLG